MKLTSLMLLAAGASARHHLQHDNKNGEIMESDF